MQGFIIIPRFVFGRFRKGPTNETFAFIDLIQMAAFADTTIGGVKIQRGQAFASVRFLARRWGWSQGRVGDYLNNLAADGLITRGTSLVTIVDYDSYQGVAPKPTPRPRTEPAFDKDAAERIYALYPSSTIRTSGNRATLKSRQKDIPKITSLLKSKQQTEESLTYAIKRYLDECRDKAYLKMFYTFLNQIPDYSDCERADEPAPEPKRKVVTYKELYARYPIHQGESSEEYAERIEDIANNHWRSQGYEVTQ